jgi:hypothetical protein
MATTMGTIFIVSHDRKGAFLLKFENTEQFQREESARGDRNLWLEQKVREERGDGKKNLALQSTVNTATPAKA